MLTLIRKALIGTLPASIALVAAACGLHTAKAPAPAAKHPKTAPYAWHSHVHNPYLPGDVLIADRANNRLLLVNPEKQIVWQYPSAGEKPNFPFVGPDDAFFASGYREIITNEEDSNTIAILNMASRKIVWTYGSFGKPGSTLGYLNTPDDAFLTKTKNGDVITVADIRNQRILFIDRATKQVLKQYGTTGVAYHNPPTAYNAPNGDFPGPNGTMLVTEINGSYIDLLSPTGQLLWTVQLPIYYPSDANYTPNGNIIVASYSTPGAIIMVQPKTGKVLWKYSVASGPGELKNPSLAVELPNGMVLANDDDQNRVIVIDPKTNKIVWQYGHTGVAGSAPGYLNDPDGTDFLPAGVNLPGIR